MLNDIHDIKVRFDAPETLEGRIDRAFEAIKVFGFDALIYDYTPVPFDHTGALMIPSLLELRNIPDEMREYWCEREYFRIDPVQQQAVGTTTPFFWNYSVEADTVINRFMNDDHAPVAHYLRERNMLCGTTVPIHLLRGDYATVTGVRFGADKGFERDATRYLADFGLLANIFHEAAFSLFGEEARSCAAIRLTARERECMRYSADGLSAKEIARQIQRSVPTVVMHLNAAAKKLGAKNRVQAVVRAAHYRLLD
ncbi:helix-turn-helix transcriptional regulator [Phyllobacterium endophyticum]|jgi:LuxR family transcriptional regulator|uniref:LuxR family transcriptional regulator n=1 Tax=Phyllobacterium endophyticum TaxID=1149773 RepID=A0A2P7B1S9_9HYPH|nr:LuxR family transcriptional regulator [Phyllobacterium endophyticum]MBB3237990.1 LuxR family transcriptional regulator [Phyllobacterium endophyticum]PSH60410.1 LuxR family transcriptional regulator [Phyllobacterium endophyticum]TXR49766.1 LuxR family transcriptional regulator [Phyllobacterium endophyticum]TYR42587.1 LuxR family transcriptional regulator [Phyllobacterium endophyticum]